MTPEAKVKAAVKKVLDTSGVYFFMPAANGFGRAGIPDIIGCINGQFLAVECKAGKGTTTALQDRELQRVRDAGGAALIVRDDTESFEALGTAIQQLKQKSSIW